MAANTLKTPIFKAISSRSYSNQKLMPISGVICDIKTTVLPNKLVVASADSGSLITRLSIVFRAGPRYENPCNQGAAHVLRIAAGLSTKNYTNFAITRNIQQAGASLTCTTDRETISYTLEGPYDAVDSSSQYLSDIANQQVFKPWEISDCTPRIKYELASLSPQVKAVNFLHRAAYRTGLGNSMFCSKHNVGKVSTETLQHFVANHFKTGHTAVVGLGVDHDQLIKYAENICLDSGDTKNDKTTYHGGEIRSEKGGELAYVTVASEGASYVNESDALAFLVLQRIYGVGSYVKRGIESNGILSKAVGAECNLVAIAALNASYSDSGLFGFMLAVPAEEARDAVNNAAKTLKSGNFSKEQVERAKNQLKTHTLLSAESGGKFINIMGRQAVLTGCAKSPEQLVEAIENVSVDAVNKAASKVSSSPLSIASVGNLMNVPYLDELE